jgi:hypothetical protein
MKVLFGLIFFLFVTRAGQAFTVRVGLKIFKQVPIEFHSISIWMGDFFEIVVFRLPNFSDEPSRSVTKFNPALTCHNRTFF